MKKLNYQKLPSKPDWALTGVSAPRQVIFLHTLKSCGTSIYEVARKYDNFHYSPQPGHLQVSEAARGVRDHRYGGFIFNYGGCFTFTIIRNPFDRLVSAWLMHRRNGFSDCTLDTAISIASRRSFPYSDSYSHQRGLWDHTRPMVWSPIHMLDFIGRYESLPETWAHIQREVGIVDDLPLKNSGKFRDRDYRSFYTPSQMLQVTKIYEDDLAEFQYEF